MDNRGYYDLFHLDGSGTATVESGRGPDHDHEGRALQQRLPIWKSHVIQSLSSFSHSDPDGALEKVLGDGTLGCENKF